MENIEALDYCLEEFRNKNIEKAKAVLVSSEKSELYFNHDKMNMFRTTFNTNLELTALISGKKGMKVLNKLDKESLDEAISETIALAEVAQPDEANDISENHPSESFASGIMSPDRDKMYDRLDEFLSEAKAKYPITNLEEGGLSFVKTTTIHKNSNGVNYTAVSGAYDFGLMFTSKDGEKTSSFNYTDFDMADLDRKLLDCANLNELLKQSTEQIDARAFDQKFEGEIIITPDCFPAFIYPVTGHLGDYTHITNTSLFRDCLHKPVASEIFTLRSLPLSDDMTVKSFFTGDGYKTENLNLIENGVLNSFLLSLYGAKKTGKERAVCGGGFWSVDPGDKKLQEMIKSVKKGILLCRFSGGEPNDNGDFSGIAKNSYYIEDGEIKYPVKEIMITGNVIKMLKNITEISEERIHFGTNILPWIKVKDMKISGK